MRKEANRGQDLVTISSATVMVSPPPRLPSTALSNGPDILWQTVLLVVSKDCCLSNGALCASSNLSSLSLFRHFHFFGLGSTDRRLVSCDTPPPSAPFDAAELPREHPFKQSLCECSGVRRRRTRRRHIHWWEWQISSINRPRIIDLRRGEGGGERLATGRTAAGGKRAQDIDGDHRCRGRPPRTPSREHSKQSEQSFWSDSSSVPLEVLSLSVS